jgi:hypothetical protein
VKPILFALRALKVGRIDIIGIQFKLCGVVKGIVTVGRERERGTRLFVGLEGAISSALCSGRGEKGWRGREGKLK